MSNEYAKQRNAAIDLIRSLSMLYIVGYWHLFNYTTAFPHYKNPLTHRISIIVLGLFVLISGYLVGYKIVIHNKSEVVQFYKKRLLRIYPPFLLAIFLFYFLKISDPIKLCKSAVLISMFSRPVTPTLWFIAMIMFFYVISPLLINTSDSIRRFTVTCVALLATTVIYNVCSGLVDLRVVIYFPSFAVGVLMARNRSWFNYISSKINALIVLLMISIALSFNNLVPLEKNLLTMPLALAGSLLFFVVLMRREKGLGHPAVTFVCEASFFMYLFHRPVFLILCNFYFPKSGPLQIVYLYMICLPVIVAFSWAGQKLYDRLILQLTKVASGGVAA